MASSRFQSQFPVGPSNDYGPSSAYPEIQLAQGVASADSRNEINSFSSETSVRPTCGPLLHAAKAGDSEMVRLILGRGAADVNEAEGGALALTAVHYAAMTGNEELMSLLVTHPDIDVNFQDGLGRTALIIACKEGHSRIVRLLLERGADVLICARGDFTCLHMAAFCGHEAAVNLLLHGKETREFWERRDYSRYLPLLPLQVRFELLNKMSSLEKFTALHMVARGNHNRLVGIAASIVEAYMATTLEIHEFGPFNTSEMFLMVNENWYQDVLLEIRDIINVHEDKRSSEGTQHHFQDNHRRQRSMNSMKQKFEGVAVYEALVEAFADLISYVNAGDCLGRTVLHYAAWHDRSAMVEFLVWDFQQRLSLGNIANVNATDLDGYTPLHLAAWKGNPSVVEALLLDSRERFKFGLHDPELKFVENEFTIIGLDYGENYHECNNLQPNSVATANGRSHKVAAEVELESEFQDEVGRNIDQSSLLPRPKLQTVLWKEERGGLTPLHYAVERNHADVVELLLSHPKIDVFGESSDGKTAWTMAFPQGRVCETWNTDIPWMLRTGGRKLNRVPPLEDELLKLRSPRSYKYTQILVEKAVSLASAESEPELSNKLTLFIVLEIQICLSLMESFIKGNDHLDQFFKGSNFSYDRIKDKLQKWELDRSKKPWKLNLLHVTIYHGFHKELKKLLTLSTFKEGLNAREKITGRTALDLAVILCNTGAVSILLQEATLAAAESATDGRTPLEIAVDMQSKHGQRGPERWSKDGKRGSEKWKGIEGLLKGRPDVQRYIDNLYRDRQVFVDAANAILVGAALIASVTFAGWLQPPLNYTNYYEEPPPQGAPPGTFQQFAAVEQHFTVRLFWTFNSLSFFSAVATVVAGAGTVLPAPGQFIKTEVQTVRRWLVFTSMLLSVSIFCVLGAFTAAGFASLPPIAKYRNNMIYTSIIGLLLCLLVLAAFLHKLYLTVKSRLHNALKYVKILYATVKKHK